MRGTLPARFGLRLAAQFGAVEGKVLVLRRSMKIGRRAAEQMPAQINLPVRQGAILHDFVEGRKKFRLTYDHVRKFSQACGFKVAWPRRSRIRRGEVLHF